MNATSPRGIQFSDDNVVNPEDFDPEGTYNTHSIRPFLLHDHGFVVAVVFASCLQDAIDEAVDCNRMERYLIADEDMGDYKDGEGMLDSVSFLGNAGEPHDIETLDCEELPNPPFSFVALYNAEKSKTT